MKSPGLYQCGGHQAQDVEDMAQCYTLEGGGTAAGELAPFWEETAIDDGERKRCGEEGEDREGARGDRKAGPEVAVHGQGLEDCEAAYDPNWGAYEDG